MSGHFAASRLVGLLGAAGSTVATAESLTGGLVAASLVEVPGVSAVFRGGVVAYAADLKARLLAVDEALLAAEGTVHPDVARQMAAGVRELCGATFGIATTGVAGPDGVDGKPAGTVYIAVSGPAGTTVRPLKLDGDREAVRRGTADAALRLAEDILVGGTPSGNAT